METEMPEQGERRQEPFDAPTYTCPQCRVAFVPTGSQRKNRRSVSSQVSYCSLKCRYAAQADARRTPGVEGVKGDRGPVRGPCAACGEPFRSFGAKKYCTMKCYTESPEFRERIIAQAKAASERLRVAAGAADPTQSRVTLNCLQCEAEFTKSFARRGAKFCSKLCRRRYFAERFDRWVANPESLALPQCYDEFLIQEELPCLIKGCGWVGKNLGSHANHVHGVSAAELKRLAGFNKTTGLCAPSVSEALSARPNQGQSAEFMRAIDPRAKVETDAPEESRELRLEAREHFSKIQSLNANTINPDRESAKCPACGEAVTQMISGLRVYCSVKCRTREYGKRFRKKDRPLACDWCSAAFLGTREQEIKKGRGFAIFCGKSCASKCARSKARRTA